MKFGCPYCHTFCERDESSSGSIITCPNCGRDFQISTLPTTANRFSLSPQSSPSPKSRIWSWVALIVTIALVGVIVERQHQHELKLAETQYINAQELADKDVQIAEIKKEESDWVATTGLIGGALILVGTIVKVAWNSGN